MKRFSKKIIALLLTMGMMITLVPTVKVNADESSVIKTKYGKDDIYYSDDYFSHSSTVYDSHLATLSMLMAKFSMNVDGPDDENDTEWYDKQSNRVKGFFEAIGFKDFEANEDYHKRTSFDTIGIAIASKKIDNYTVIGLVPRSGGYFLEWGNNVWLGDGTKSDYMHEGWYNAANKAINFLDGYISSKNITGNIKLWVAGYSRGGATANLIAGLLDNKIDKGQQIFSNGATLKHDDLFGYTLEAPQGANYYSQTIKKPGDAIYNNIWNIVNPNDLVTKVAMSEWGFTRFGTDKYITTKFYDSSNFNNNRKTFKALYGINNDVNTYSADSLTMTGIFSEDDTKKNYDANIVTTIILGELTAGIKTRDAYVADLQSGMRDFLNELMSDTHEGGEITWETIALGVGLSVLEAGGEKLSTLTDLYYGDQEVVRLATKFLNPLIYKLVDVYKVKPIELVSLIKNVGNIFCNHETDVSLAHVEAQDTYYIKGYNDEHDSNISIVELRETADFGRLEFLGFNEVGVYSNTGSGLNNEVNIVGHAFGGSDINRCNGGYAAGYYSYFSEERLEIIIPANQEYVINMKSISKKPYHDVRYSATRYYIGSNIDGYYRVVKGSYSDSVAFNSDFIQKGLNMHK